MRNLTKTFLISVMAVGLMACSGGEPAANSTTVAETAADVVCCGGNCDAPAGTCCGDGTCGGNHAELPLAPKI